MVALLALEEAGIQTLRLVLWSYDRIVVVVTAAQLLRVCAYNYKVDGSSLHMCIIFFGSTAGIFFQLEKELFDDECRRLI